MHLSSPCFNVLFRFSLEKPDCTSQDFSEESFFQDQIGTNFCWEFHVSWPLTIFLLASYRCWLSFEVIDFVTKHHSIAFLMICQCISAISNHLSSQLQEASKFYLFSSLKYHHRLLFIHIHSSTHYMFASSCSHLSNAQDLWSIQLFTFLPHVTFTPAPIRTMLIAAYSILQFKALLISLILSQVLSLWFTSQGID